eukprot:269882-Alexandrium_andersonii.AAC.1
MASIGAPHELLQDLLLAMAAPAADRQAHFPPEAARLMAAAHAKNWLTVSGTASAVSYSQAVSYTHLRAHETSAHL